MDPVRLRYIEALTRRAAAHDGAVRQMLDAKLAALLAAYGERQARPAPTPAAEPGHALRGPLADLVHELDRQPAPGDTAPAELKALRQFRSTWARLHVDQQLTRSLAKSPDNPGPLNSHRLVLRALQSLQDSAPEYLNRFLPYVDALSWLEQARGGSPSGPGNVLVRDGDRKRKPGRGKAG